MKALEINGATLTYHIIRKPVKNVNMRVKNDGVIYVSANKSVTCEYIEELLVQRMNFFLSAIAKIEASSLIKSDASVMRYLGKTYEVEIAVNSFEKTELNGNKIIIATKGPSLSDDEILFRIRRWQGDRCMEMYKSVNEEVYRDFIKHSYPVPHACVYIKEMKTRWGSCNARDGKISMNLKLIELPEECVYAVFYHEYMHFIHNNHSADFHNALNAIFPDYEVCDRILKEKNAV